MDIMEKFLQTIQVNNLIEKGEGIVVGVSGGPDSVCLLHLLWRIRKDFNIDIYVVHLDHQFRGIEAQKDARYVEKLCNTLGIKSFIFSYDVSKYSKEKGVTFEVAGRELRYKLFDQIAKETDSSKIAIAQNRNDQAETVLMRLFRGSGLDGLTAINYKRDNKIIRPLLDITRKEIDEYCRENDLKPRIDKTNLESIYTRNKVRIELIPYIEKNFNPCIIDVLWRSANLLRDDSNYLNLLSEEKLRDITIEKNSNKCSLDYKKFNRLDIAIKRRVIRGAIREIKGDLKDLGLTHIESVIELIDKKNVGAKIDLPGHITVELGYNSIDVKNSKKLQDENSTYDFEYELNIGKITYIRPLNASIKAEIIDGLKSYNNRDRYVAFVDYNKVKGRLLIRNRRNGDRFKPIGMKGTKKIKDYFIDKKISKDIRDKIPLLCDDKGIIWVIGYRMSENYKIDKKTDKVIKLTYREGCLEN
ncbi:tRNA lysidine(34) synthetase TilS [Paramaledivibacter caminithermalis]|uniref:tRNA(Ile)-lysidine synthase n=1 Tax=Paramaledivibacter caminithermalis (strain DSM 15212 / CIP 107654 / DViRD3) TaxID=1121301 RepID=A0A1M6N0C3_PARC5|nr:tRNA lysidine(34) synthetase TilS [Paramaledivibacter caminithermalis]SHJ89134.1 tRNA(Ile)-lysidine synthase [Paramaledivibacter caminithermalis DSM 15212]